MKTSTTVCACFFMGLPVACGASQAPVATASGASSTSASAAASVAETPSQAATSGTLRISADILRACGLSDTDAYFPFDSARLEKQDIQPLNAIAICFATGGLKGRAVKLIGHADPRGSVGYNMTLGQSRADGVAGYLERKGIEKAKVETTSRGAMDATGTDEAGWTHDRRVDVTIGN
jgi:peptidoglycan-associated lipoprotein